MKSLFFVILFFSFLSHGAEIEVRGVCQEKVAPDLFSFNIDISYLDKDLKKSFREANKRYKDVVNHYKRKFEVQTESINTFEEFDYSNRKKKFIGHKTQIRVKVQTKDKRVLEEGLYSLFNFKDIKVSGVKIRISPEKLRIEKEKCFLKAVDNAEKKAAAVAKEIGEKVKKVLKIKELGGRVEITPQPMMRQQMLKATESTPIEALDQVITVEAFIIVETEK